MIRRVLAFVVMGSFVLWVAADQVDIKSLPAPAGRQIDFVKDVEPIFAQSCYMCHGPAKQRGSLRLDQPGTAVQTGIVVPGKSAESLLIRYVAGLDPDIVMPPKGQPRLTAEQIGILRAWIDQGGRWPAVAKTPAKQETWWSLRPLQRPAVPIVADKSWRIRNPIDAFVLAKLQGEKLAPSPEADRRTLIRRVYFDLTGLPPSPEEFDAFAADNSPTAYETLVDRLLDSPRYGERWARHWLDVVHYGETHGYDKDKPRPNAWPYRDYVIRAFNEDKPYGQFIEEQLAGDVLYPGTVDGIEALGFLSAGPWDFIGHAEVPESRIDGKITRHLDRDDMVANTMGTFNSMTVSCAQCHDHKFDPITMEDYYSLHAVFAAIDRADKRYHADPKVMARRAGLERRQRELEDAVRAIEARIQVRGGKELADLDARIALANRPAVQVRRPEYGYHSAIAPDATRLKWVQVDLGRKTDIKEVVLIGCYDDFANIGAGFGFPPRFKVEVADDADFKDGVHVVMDRTSRDVPNPGTEPQAIKVGASGRFVRVTATKLAFRQNDYIFALAEMVVNDKAGKNIALGKAVTSLDSIEALPRWSRKNLVDGIANMSGPPSGRQDLARLKEERQALLARVVDPKTAEEFKATTEALADARGELAKLPPAQVVYAGAVHHGSGAFQGTGAAGGKPRPIFILARGDVRKPGKEVGPGALAAMTDLSARFALPAGHGEADRRAALARWLSDKKNHLTWRSIVNRVWLYHFGRGLVDSPNDFGRMGQLPTHPELLDWLACEFRDGGQSLKKLHRLIVTSATYRQSSADRPEFAKIDTGNQYYWRMTRRRLEAEAVRDSMLAVSGKLNLKMGGPSFQDFVIKHPEHSPHYKYELHDPEDAASHRRSIYRFVVRSQQQPFLMTLDCADPSLAVDKRNQTITPQQALVLLNNQLALVMAKHFAQRVRKLEPDADRQAALAFRLALGRAPTAQEADPLARYGKQHGLENVCRLVLNLNEFVFID